MTLWYLGPAERQRVLRRMACTLATVVVLAAGVPAVMIYELSALPLPLLVALTPGCDLCTLAWPQEAWCWR